MNSYNDVTDEAPIIPYEIWKHEIYKSLYDIDKQILRKVSRFFTKLTPYKEITFHNTQLALPHLKIYKHHIDSTTTNHLAQYGDLDCIGYSHSKGSTITSLGIMHIVEHGYLYCLKYIYENWDHGLRKADLNQEVTKYACINGKLDILIYAYEQGFKIHRQSTMFAAANGHIECLWYLYKRGHKLSDHPSCLETNILVKRMVEENY